MSQFRAALRLAAASVAVMLSFASTRIGAIGAAAETRRHAGDRHRLRHAVGAVVRQRRLELEAQPRHRRGLRTAVRRRSLEVEAARRQASVLCRRLAAVRRHPRRTGGELGVEEGSAPPRDEPAQGRDVSGKARRDGGARTGRRRRRVQPTTASTRARRRSPAISTISTRSRPPTSTRSCSPSRTTTPNGTTASAGATTPASSRRKSPTPAPATGRTSTAPGRSCSATSCRAIPTPMSKNPNYWDKEKINGVETKLPLRRQGGLSHHQG